VIFNAGQVLKSVMYILYHLMVQAGF